MKTEQIEVKGEELVTAPKKEKRIQSELYYMKQFKGAVSNMNTAGMLDEEDKEKLNKLAEKLTKKWLGGSLF